MSGQDPRVLDHRRFGRLEIPETDVLHFEGLPGFPDTRHFALVAHDREGIFAWLVSLDDPTLAFVVSDPWQFYPDYEPSLPGTLLAQIGAKTREDVEVLVMVTVREGRPTLNLAAPLVLCAPARRGAQWILDDARLSARQPLPDLHAPASGPDASGQIESKPQR